MERGPVPEFPQWGSNFMLPFRDDYKPPEMKEAAN
jgi:hypothetical protein